MYVSVNIHNDANKEKLESLKALPDSCMASADALEEMRAMFEKDGVFSKLLIDGIIRTLRGFDDRDLRKKAESSHNEMMNIVRKYWHCG